jgi:hypothetical protein
MNLIIKSEVVVKNIKWELKENNHNELYKDV